MSVARTRRQPPDSFELKYEEKKDVLGPNLCHLLRGIDVDRNGELSVKELREAEEIVRLARVAKQNNSGSIGYTHMPKCIQEVMRKWDVNDNGEVSVNELQKAAAAFQKKSERLRMMQFAVIAMVIAIVFMAAATFFATHMAVELAKEMHAGSNGVMTTSDGHRARIGSAETLVQDGTLVPFSSSVANASCKDSTNVSCGAPAAAIATRPAEVERTLASTIPDHLLRELSKLTIRGADGVSHMTVQILGFTRVLAASKCGSLVHLSALHGTMTLDDTDLIFDQALSDRALSLGIELGDSTAHGRRLASGALVAGLFNFFEDYDWQCNSVQAPKSPSKPYVIQTVKRAPCPTSGQCSSTLGLNIMLPGFDEETNSVITAETFAETDRFTLSIQRFPNHPLQMLVTVIDHALRTHRSMQVFNGSAYYCMSQNYSVVMGNATDTLDSYFPAFLGVEKRPAETFQLPWGMAAVPARQVRVFRLQPKDDVDGALPIPVNYEDDAETFLPTRLHFNGAREMELDVEDILVESLQNNAASAAQQLLQKFTAVDCTVTQHHGVLDDPPRMTSPFTEDTADVDFYVQKYVAFDEAAVQNLPEGFADGYWAQAMQREDAENLRNASTRRLLSRRARRLQEVDGGFEVEIGDDVTLAAGVSDGCFSMSGEVSKKTSPWKFWGQLDMGKGCEDGNAFTVDRRVGVKYGWEVKKDYKINLFVYKAKIEFECGLGIYGYIGGRTGVYNYNCGRRLSGPETGNRSIDADTEEFQELEDIEQNAESTSTRRLGIFDRRRRRRRRMCRKAGFTVIAGVGVEGGCAVSRRRIGVSLEGSLDMSIGQWPRPLDDRAKGYISAKGCIKIGPFKGCIGFPSKKLFDINI